MSMNRPVTTCGLVAIFVLGGGVGLAQPLAIPPQSAVASPNPNTARSGFFEVIEPTNSGKALMLTDPDNPSQRLALKRVAVVLANDIETAQADFNQLGLPMIAIKLTARGRTRLSNFTTGSIGRRLAIVIDDRILSAPTVVQPITGGHVELGGNFTFEEAQRLAAAIKSRQ
jgi:preprotein translocase subunit SecD